MIFLDVETRSAQDLRKTSVYRYCADPDFSILMAAWAYKDEPVQLAVGHAQINAIPGLWDNGVLKVAHNAAFERTALSVLWGARLDPEPWVDTMALAAEYGYPMGLAPLAAALGTTPKDSAGTRLINLFCKPNRAGGWNDATSHPAEWQQFLAYCRQDVETLREVYHRLPSWPTITERRLWSVDQHINDAGMAVDVGMITAAQKAVEANAIEARREVKAISGIDNPGSVPQVLTWLRGTGLDIADLQAETVETYLAGPLTDQQRQVLSLRQELAGSASKKYTAALASVCADGRIRGSFKFFAAHTGRWGGRGVQPQNLSRAQLASEAHVEAAILDLRLGLGASPATLKALVRAMFIGPLTTMDYEAIEARVAAWLAGEQWALDAFRAGRDIYTETATRMGGLTRSQGKVACLALQFNGGVNSLRVMGAEGSDDELQMMVNVWRRANPRIVGLWSKMEEAIEDGGQVGPHLHITRQGSSMALHLPSGRAIYYHGVRFDTYRIDGVRKQGWRYDDSKRPGRIGTYGGRCVQNAVQAVARDLLAEALIRLHDKGFPIVGHVHDEIILDGAHDVEMISEVMCSVPEWAAGLPVAAKGSVMARYQK